MSHDHYAYPGTNILVNKLGITDNTELMAKERGLSHANACELRLEGVTGKFDAAHLKSIHKRLFGDIYDWAGEFRDIDIYKGLSEFSSPDEIAGRLDELCRDIKFADYYRGLPKREAAARLAGAMAELNNIHPFRDGNGRTQRLFIEQLAANAGYDLDFSKMSENDMRNASMAASRGNLRLFSYLFESGMSENGVFGPVSNMPLEEALDQAGGKIIIAHGSGGSVAQKLFKMLSRQAETKAKDDRNSRL